MSDTETHDEAVDGAVRRLRGVGMTDTTEQTATEQAEPQGVQEVRAALKRETKRRQEAEDKAAGLESALGVTSEKLREATAAGASDAERLGDLTGEVTFLRAGIDTSKPIAARFFTDYDGPMEPDAIQTAWAGYLDDASVEAHDFAAHLVRTNGGTPDA